MAGTVKYAQELNRVGTTDAPGGTLYLSPLVR
jgi:hypothetical protein